MPDPTPKPARRPPGTRAEYCRFVPITLRWLDNDAFGHVNNVHYYSFFDTAVTQVLGDLGVLASADSDRAIGTIMVVAESGCRYHQEIAYPGQIDVGVRLAHLGGSSLRTDTGVFLAGADTAAAEGFMVHVCVGSTERRPVPLLPAWRTALESLRKE